MIPPDGFVFDGYFESRYHGFGVLGEYLQGFFWFMTGRPESANLVGYFSLILYILFLKRYFKVPFYLSTIGLLQSREGWKCKATERGYENRGYRKSQKRHLEKIAELKVQLDEAKQTDMLKKKQFPQPPLLK